MTTSDLDEGEGSDPIVEPDSIEERIEHLEEQVERLVGGGGLSLWLSAIALALAVYAAFFR